MATIHRADGPPVAWNAHALGSAVTGVGQSAAEPLLEIGYPAVPESCPQARHAVRAALEGVPVDLAAVDLAVAEAVANVVVHAYRDREPGEEPGRVWVSVSIEPEHVRIRVADDGVGMTPRTDSPGLGLGLSLIANLCDELLIIQGDTGTRVHMRYACRPAASGGRGAVD
jgi:anti-sigma regulatory factor (Ser/Thr protein kinase)